MSYILDALKRAESERERGAVPGLNAQPLHSSDPVNGQRHPAIRPALMWAAVTALVTVVVGVGWWRLGTSATPAPAVALADPRAAPVIDAPPVTAPLAAARLPAPDPVLVPAPQIAPVSQPPAALPPQIASPHAPAAQIPPGSTQGKTQSTPPSQPTKQGQATTPIPATPAVLALPAPQAIQAIGELAADVRQALPKLVISGSTYSDSPSYRMLIINGQVFHEGEKPAADLTLEQIRLKSAVLNYKGTRYALPY